MRQLKSITTDKLTAYADVLDGLQGTGRVATVSSAATITENAALYQTVTDPFGLLSTDTGDELVAVDEYTAWCLENGLMTEVGGDATLGELAVSFMTAMGYSCDADTAIATLSQAGVMPSDAADTPLTRERLMTYSCALLEMSGFTFTDAAMPECPDAADITTGLEDLWAWSLQNGLMSLTEDGRVAPRQTATRTELAYALYALMAE